MIEAAVQFLQTNILPLGPLGVFLASVIEEIIAPIPSAVVVLTSGFLFLSGPFSATLVLKLLFYVVLPATVGITIGSLFIYGILYWGGEPFIKKYGKWLGISWDDILRVEERLKKGRADDYAIILLRAIPIVPSSAVAAFCGLFQYPLRKYLILTFIGVIFRTTVLGILGWQAGNVYFKYAEVIEKFESSILAILVLAVVIFIFYHRKKFKRKHDVV